MVRDNQELAILTKVNDLAERHGMKPFNFSASVGYDAIRDLTVLDFGHIDREFGDAADKMLDLLDPARRDGGHFEGSPREMLTTLERAIASSPRSPGRR